MSVLDRQSLRGQVSNRRVSRDRLEARNRMRGRIADGDRRRPDRGLSVTGTQKPANPRRSRPRRTTLRDRWEGLLDSFVAAFRILLVVCVAPFQIVLLLLRPRDLARRAREAPVRMQSTARRLRLEARDRETVAGRAWETARLSAYFLREELADMHDGFPTTDELRGDVSGAIGALLGAAGNALGLRARRLDESVSERLGGAVVAGLVGAAVVLGLFVGAYNGFEGLKTSERLALDRIDVLGTSRVADATVLGLLAAAPGDNLLDLELDTLAAPLSGLPWVASVFVERDLAQRTLSVRLVEHRPAMILVGGTLRLVSDRGVAFKDLEPSDPTDLPLLTGLDAAMRDDPAVIEEASRGALEILHAVAGGRAIGRSDVSEIQWLGADGFVLLTRDGLPVRLGRQDFAARLGRLERAVRGGSLPLDAMASVDLGMRDRLVAVPRRQPKARGQVQKAVETQPVAPKARDRVLHLERIKRQIGLVESFDFETL